MVNTNYIGSIVKILENPNQTVFNNTIPVTTCRVQFPQLRNTRIVTLTFWGNLAHDVVKYYRVNDYILIDGYLSLNNKYCLEPVKKNSKKVEITVLKVYPFLLNQNR
jgi:hypothetical protein